MFIVPSDTDTKHTGTDTHTEHTGTDTHSIENAEIHIILELTINLSKSISPHYHIHVCISLTCV